MSRAPVFFLLVCCLVGFISSARITQDLTDRLLQHLVSTFSTARSYKEPWQKEQVRTRINTFFRRLAKERHVYARKQYFTWRDPTYHEKHKGVNYFLVAKGVHWGTPWDRISILMAHYDTMPNTPGVTDNGSGMAALLETARAITKRGKRLKNTVIFVATDFEEFGLTGSRHFVDYFAHKILSRYGISGDTFAGAYVLDQILNWSPHNGTQKAALDELRPMEEKNQNPDPLYQAYEAGTAEMDRWGRTGHYLAVFGRETDAEMLSIGENSWNQTSSGPYDMVYSWLAFPFDGPPTKALTPAQQRFAVEFLTWSDHYNFWENTAITKKGLKSVFFTDTGRFRGYMQKCAGEPCDDLTHTNQGNMAFLTRTTEMLIKIFECLSMDICPRTS